VTITVANFEDVITASFSGVSGISNSFHVFPAPLHHFSFSPIAASQTAGVAFPDTIRARDQYENLVYTFSSTIALDDLTDNHMSPTSVFINAGEWKGNITITEAIAVDSITASGGGKTGSSNPFTVNNNVLHHFDWSNIATPQTAGVAFRDTIWARDVHGNLVDEFGSIANLEDETGSLSPTTADFNAGIWTDNLTVDVATASDFLTVRYDTIDDTSNSFAVLHNVLDHFGFSTIASPQTAGVAFRDTIWAQDAYGNTITEFTQKVDLWDSSNSLLPDSSGSFVNGVWSGFFRVDNVYTNDRIFALGGGEFGQSNLFNVVASEVDHFEFDPITGDKTAGIPFPIIIYAKDASGNTVTSYNGHAFLSDSTGTINPDETIGNFENGVWQGDVTITRSFTNDWIRARDTENDIEGTSDFFDVVAAGLYEFYFNPIPNQTAGTFNITIYAWDQYENIVRTFESSVSLSDSTGMINPQASQPFVDGVLLNQPVTVTEALVGEWIEATYGTATGRSNLFTISPGPLNRFEFDDIEDQTAGVPFAITIFAYDAHGNVKTNYAGSAALIDQTGTIEPDSAIGFSAGVWQGAVTIFESHTNDWITAFVQSGQFGVSTPFTVGAGQLDHFSFSAIGTPQEAGVSFPVAVTALDSLENRLMNFNQAIELFDLTGTYTDTVAMTAGQVTTSVVITQATDDDLLTAAYGLVESQSNAFDVTSGDPEFLVLEPPGPLNITVEAEQVFTGTVTDPYGNRVPAATVTFLLSYGGIAHGSLDDNPVDPNDTFGSGTVQTGNTGPEGTLTVRYTAPEGAGLVDVLDARCNPYIGQDEVLDVTITSVDSGATRLVIIPADPQQIRVDAAEVFSLTVEAQDGNGNVDIDDTTRVRISSATGAVEFSRDNFTTPLVEWNLSAGSDTVQARSCIAADNDTIHVQDIDGIGVPLSPGVKSQVYIEQGLPWGEIVLAASRDTITANGISTTTISSGSIADSCGNYVPAGTFVTISASPDSLVTLPTDQNTDIPGVQVAADAGGSIEFTVRARTTGGTCTVTARSVEGSAEGMIDILLQEPPFLVYAESSLYPNTVSPAESVSFRVLVKNEGEAGITLSTSTFFRFTDDIHPYIAFLEAPLSLPGGSNWDTLAFAEEPIPDSIRVSSYTPTVYLQGVDTNGSGYMQTLQLDPSGLQVSQMKLLYVQVPVDTASVDDSLEVTLAVENMSSQSVTIDSYGLVITPLGSFTMVTAGPVVIGPGGTGYPEVGLKIGTLTPTGMYYVDAFVSGTSGGGEVSDNSADLIDSLVVVSIATAEYVPGSLAPDSLSPGGDYSLRVRVKNTGESAVNLNAQQTKISFSNDSEAYEAPLAVGIQMPGGGAETQLVFSERTLASGFPTGESPVSVHLIGETLNGGEFEAHLADADTVRVQSPAAVVYMEGSLNRRKISRGFPLTLSVRVTNTGEARLALDAQQTSMLITDGEATYKPLLNAGLVDEVSAGDTTLTFLSATFPSSFEPGTYAPLLILAGNYNGIGLHDTLAVDSVTVQIPATLAVDAHRSDTVVTIGQAFEVNAIVTNRGQAGLADGGTLSLDLADSPFGVEDPLRSFGPHLPDTAVWTVTVPDTSTIGIYDISVVIETVPHDGNTDPPQSALLYQGGRDVVSISIVEGNDLAVSTLSIPGIPPGNVSAGQSGIPVLALQLANRGNARNEIRLDSMRVSLRERDGGAISPASDVIEGLLVAHDAGGSSVIAQAAGLGGQTILLDFSGADFRLGTAPDTLFFSMSIGDSPRSETVLLHVAGGEDIHAVDTSNGHVAAAVDPLGTPLGELASAFLVLNDDDFGTSFKNFPNPFRAGAENTTFSYYLPGRANLDLTIYTLTGELVKKFHFDSGTSGGSGPGMNSFAWDGRNGGGHVVLNGVYLCIVEADLEAGSTLSLKHKVAVLK
jgi:hypothetical protein